MNVQISDAGGTSNQSFVYLPAGFPRIQASRSGAGPSAGAVFLGLNSYLSETTYQTAVDEHGVPHGGIKDIGSGWILEFRDPDNIALEVYANKA